MTANIQLRGMTWNHVRGFVPMVATAQRFEEQHPGVSIHWEKRSLNDFEHYSVEDLARNYDLMVIDHPWIGHAAETEAFLNLSTHMDAKTLAAIGENAVGPSFRSYEWKGSQWALPIDAAAPVACWNPARMAEHSLDPPETWEDLLDWAKQGRVLLPAGAIYSLMNFIALCDVLGSEAFTSQSQLVELNAGVEAVERLREVLSHCPACCLEMNPIHGHEALAKAGPGDPFYTPWVYPYINYAREGYAQNPLRFGLSIRVGQQIPRTVLGGTGIAISAQCKHVDTATEYAGSVASAFSQKGLFFQAGGQPANRQAWQSETTNRACGDFFTACLEAHERALLRSRHRGYVPFQESAGAVIHSSLKGQLTPTEAVQKINKLYQDSFTHAH